MKNGGAVVRQRARAETAGGSAVADLQSAAAVDVDGSGAGVGGVEDQTAVVDDIQRSAAGDGAGGQSVTRVGNRDGTGCKRCGQADGRLRRAVRIKSNVVRFCVSEERTAETQRPECGA